MNSTNRYSDYDNRADVYDEELSLDSYEVLVDQLDNLLLQNLPKRAHIFDICCGKGQVAQRLLKKGYRVTGLDGSEKMLHYARKNASGAEFILDDARYFKLPSTFHAVISTNRSLSHVMNLAELKKVFYNVYIALLKSGIFLFDLYIEENDKSMISGGSNSQIFEKIVTIDSWNYNSKNKLGKGSVVNFQLISKNWQRSDWNYSFRAYSSTEIQQALEEIGFTQVSVYYVGRDLGVDIGKESDWGCVICRK